MGLQSPMQRSSVLMLVRSIREREGVNHGFLAFESNEDDSLIKSKRVVLASTAVFLAPHPQGACYELRFIVPHLAQVHHSLSMKFPQT